MMYNLLVDGKKELERALRWQGLDLELEVNLKKTSKSHEEEDVEKLKKLFNEKIKIK